MIGTFLPLVLLSFTTMVSSCVAYGCTNRSKSGSGQSFFRFPLMKPELLGKWVQAIHRKNWSPNNYSRICSDHFDPSCLVKKPGKIGLILTENAVPSIFQAFPKHLQAIPEADNIKICQPETEDLWKKVYRDGHTQKCAFTEAHINKNNSFQKLIESCGFLIVHM